MTSIQSAVPFPASFSPPIASQAEMADSTYNEVPYGSYPIAASHPDKLFAVGKLFGVNPVPPERARILELGCAGGGNLLPIASQFPNATCVGFDLSQAQVDVAKVAVQFCKLSNTKIQQGSIADINETHGKFDYIICHGVFSWVPEQVREAILRVSAQNLSENGIAYISYNTMPGWYQRGMIRDMMLRHVNGIKDAAAKTTQARALLAFLVKSTDSHSSPYAAYLKSEAEFLDKQPDAYLFHDHLEDNNKAYFFQDFIRFATPYGLQFLGESNISAMWAGNLSKETSQKLDSISDAVVSGHYLDCILGRSFRQTLLVHAGKSISRSLDPTRFEGIQFSGQFIEQPQSEAGSVRKDYKTKNGQIMFTSELPTQCALDALTDAFPGSLTIDQVIHAMEQGLVKSGSTATVNRPLIAAELMRWVLSGFADFRFQPDRLATKPIGNPKATSWARSQAQASRYVTNLIHELVVLTDVDRHIILLLDGSRDMKAIESAIAEMIRSDVIVSVTDAVPLGKKAREVPSRIAHEAVDRIGKMGLLLPNH